MFGMKNPADMCEECAAANKNATYMGIGAGVLLGSALCFVVLKYVARQFQLHNFDCANSFNVFNREEEIMAYNDQWSNRKFPNGCRSCGQTEKKHVGFGLCQNCYRQLDIRDAAKNDTLEERPVVEEIISDEIGVEPTEGITAERRPGSFNSPVNENGDVQSDPIEEPKKKNRFGFGKKEPKQDYQAPRTGEKPPRGVTRRVSVSDTLEDVWTGVGGLAIRTNHAPLGRYMQWQAPAAGQLLDEVVAGTIIDKKVLQPAVKAR